MTHEQNFERLYYKFSHFLQKNVRFNLVVVIFQYWE